MTNSNYKFNCFTLFVVIIIISTFAYSLFPINLLKDKRKSQLVTFELEDLSTNAIDITIITPENKTYTQPDSGYYPATYGFENDEVGSEPEQWQIRGVGEPNFNVSVLENLDGHKNVVEINDSNNAEFVGIRQFSMFPITFGTIEFWIRFDSINEWVQFYSADFGNTAVPLSIRVENGKWRYRLPSGSTDIPNVVDPQNDTWHHVRIDFRCYNAPSYLGISNDRFIAIIDGVSSGELLHWASGKIDYGRFGIDSDPGAIMNTWVDAVGFSWDPDYNVGDNLNQGLLLNYENTTNLEWKGFSLDGQTNRTILGNTTIPMPSDGVHNIRVFGNDTIGTIYESNVRYFTVSTSAPGISITSPVDSEFFGNLAPNFDLDISGPFESVWYTIDDGLTNITASGLTGTINQTEWTKLTDGIVTIIFYANNSGGFLGSAVVMVIKQISGIPPGIPGYDIIALLGVSCVVTLIILKKRTD